ASASSDGRVILWNFDLDDLMAKSCGWLRDYMTNPATPDDHKALCQDELTQLSSPNPLESLSWIFRFWRSRWVSMAHQYSRQSSQPSVEQSTHFPTES
ncbi:MAG: hypothetical protein F6K42_30975, partial [Leptolyngbya sp. SIO1D8]|nr:hypothetical protein [Leptolyngbya sp. SIO1D8]